MPEPHSPPKGGTPSAVLQVITDTDRRGGQVFAHDLHREIERRGCTVQTVALAPGTGNGLDFEVLGPTRRSQRTLRALRAAISESAVVVGHGSTTLPMCAIAGWGLDTPFVYRQISQQQFWARTPAQRFRTRQALRATDHVVALWTGAAETLIGTYGVDAGRITVIPNGVPSGNFQTLDQQRRRDARLRFGLDPARPTLVYLGALVPEKGVDVLVQALNDPALSGWQLLVAGAGPERARLVELASRLSPGAVRLHEPVASGREALAAADVVGLTSRGGDSMPAVLIEAGMMGIPTVATPIEGIVEVVIDGSTGALVDIDDVHGTAKAISVVGRRQRQLGEAARNHCLERFDIRTVADQWLTLLQRFSRLR